MNGHFFSMKSERTLQTVHTHHSICAISISSWNCFSKIKARITAYEMTYKLIRTIFFIEVSLQCQDNMYSIL